MKGGIGYLSQSGALLAAILDTANAHGIGFSNLVSIGNKADIDELDLIRAFGEDSDTKVIAGYLESINNGNAFVSLAEKIELIYQAFVLFVLFLCDQPYLNQVNIHGSVGPVLLMEFGKRVFKFELPSLPEIQGLYTGTVERHSSDRNNPARTILFQGIGFRIPLSLKGKCQVIFPDLQSEILFL